MNRMPHQPENQPPPPSLLYRAMAVVSGPVEKLFGITCRDFTQLASEKLDRPLTVGERFRYWSHRLICSLCRRQEERMKQLNRVAGEAIRRAGEDSAVKLNPEVRDRLRERLAREIEREN